MQLIPEIELSKNRDGYGNQTPIENVFLDEISEKNLNFTQYHIFIQTFYSNAK